MFNFKIPSVWINKRERKEKRETKSCKTNIRNIPNWKWHSVG